MRDGDGLSRRQLLMGVAGAGSVGAFAGGVTGAVLTDQESFFDNQFVAGSLELNTSWTGSGAGQTDGQQFQLDVGELEPGDSGFAELSVELPEDGDHENNPAVVWFRSTCPPEGALLDDILTVTLAYSDCAGNAVEHIRGPMSLRDFANYYREGELIPPVSGGTGSDGNCLPVGEPLCLRLYYALDPAYVGNESTSVTFEVVAVQCRHDAGATNPFGDQSVPECPEPECLCCETVGKIEFEDGDVEGIAESYVEPGTYAFSEYADGFEGYQFRVLETVTKDGGEETVAVKVQILDANGNIVTPCLANVKAGAGTETYDLEGQLTPADGTAIWLTGPTDGGPVEENPSDYRGLSHITMAACTTTPPSQCENLGWD